MPDRIERLELAVMSCITELLALKIRLGDVSEQQSIFSVTGAHNDKTVELTLPGDEPVGTVYSLVKVRGSKWIMTRQ